MSVIFDKEKLVFGKPETRKEGTVSKGTKIPRRRKEVLNADMFYSDCSWQDVCSGRNENVRRGKPHQMYIIAML